VTTMPSKKAKPPKTGGEYTCSKCGEALVNEQMIDGKTYFHCFCGEWYYIDEKRWRWEKSLD